jgi:FkbM family methyltransferase
MRLAPGKELEYMDPWGYKRVALLDDEMEAFGFTGVSLLPDTVARHIRPGDWVIDAGANIGLITAHFCWLVGASGLVWAIEPVPRNVARLKQLKVLNGLDRLLVFEGALAAAPGTAMLPLHASGGSAYASFTRSWDMAGAVEVRTWSLDDLVFRQGTGRRLALLKLDVEGYEPQVLDGAGRTLREMKPLVYCEFNDILLRDAGSSSAQLLEKFAGFGYAPLEPPPDFDGRVVDLLLSAGPRP